MNLWHIKYIYDYGEYFLDGVYFYCNPYGFMYSKIFCKETLKQVCIVTYPYTQDYIISKLARKVPVKELELDDIKNKDLIKHV
jgi:hypothetical protein